MGVAGLASPAATAATATTGIMVRRRPRGVTRFLRPREFSQTPLGDFTLQQLLGSGAYGSVYVGRNIAEPRDVVAVKIMPNTRRSWVEALIVHKVGLC